ncbi:MAG TPA: glutamine--fructose-6-phosphate transaminase (isomerizing) [Firmicutes bacterium]|nr:glutamine--fructose-6-phosphate transaminase (isomerizing) [Bacillota bacterium]
MCGIVGYIGKEKCISKILSGLESLEYRGYDSAGIAYVKDNKVNIIKEEGRIANLKEKINNNEDSYLGIGHTRWATHGRPCQVNSHPHRVGKITLVHNGIIENYESLKKELSNYEMVSETDSEVVAALIDKLYDEEKDMMKVLAKLKNYLVGSYALGIIVDGEDKIYAIRKDSPLILGVTEKGNFIASDVPAILQYTNLYYILLNDEFAVLSDDDIVIYDNEGNICTKTLLTFEGSREAAMKNGYDHFMLKEIFEQPKVVMDTIREYVTDLNTLKEKLDGLEKYEEIDIVGCGSAYHVGLVGKSLIEKYGKIRVNVDIASEYRYTNHIYKKNHLILVISQSGETADTLAVLRKAHEDGIATLAIVNVVGSSIAREADKVLYIKAGVEIAVATTKAYSCQLMMLSIIAMYLGIENGLLDESIFNEYNKVGKLIEDLLADTSDTEEVAKMICNHKDIFYLGRKIDYALCMESSLKLKEVSYLHSEAYAAGELKHGTISLIEEGTPVLSIITDDDIRLKTLSNVKEVCSRGALSIIITNEDVLDKSIYNKLIMVPKLHDLVGSVLVVIKCQLIAYYVAKYNGCDIDKPRNLAKSVTVE